MSKTTHESIDTALVERLIRMRSETSSDDECDRLHDLAVVLSGSATKDELFEFSKHMRKCPSCAETLTVLKGLEATGVLSTPSSEEIALDAVDSTNTETEEQTPARRPKIGMKPVLYISAAALFIICIGTLFLVDKTKPSASLMNTEMSVKGSSDDIFIALNRDGRDVLARPFVKLTVGEPLGMFYSSEEGGYLYVFNMENDGSSTLLYPYNGDTSGPIKAGTKVPLPDGLVTGDGMGCEWIIAIFSDAPLKTKNIENALAKTSRDLSSCRAEVEIDGARTIRVFPIRR